MFACVMRMHLIDDESVFFFLNGGGIKGWATIDKEIGTTGATMKVPICLCDF